MKLKVDIDQCSREKKTFFLFVKRNIPAEVRKTVSSQLYCNAEVKTW